MNYNIMIRISNIKFLVRVIKYLFIHKRPPFEIVSKMSGITKTLLNNVDELKEQTYCKDITKQALITDRNVCVIASRFLLRGA